MPPSAVAVPPASRRNVALFAIGILCYWAAMYVYVPTFSVYAESLGASLSLVGLAVGMYGLTQMLTRVPIGVWSDAMGKRRGIVVAGMLVCGVSAAGLALAPSPVWLVVFRGVMGLAAATWVCSTVLFTSYFPNRDPSVPLSIMSLLIALGQVAGTSCGGLLAERFGWTMPFWASMALSVIAAAVLLLPPDDTMAKPVTVSWDSLLRIAGSPLLLLACGVGAIVYFATFSTVYGFTTVLAERLGATRAQLGYLTTAALLAYGVLTILTPHLVRKLGERRTLLLGLLAITLGILPTPLVGNLGLLFVLQALSGVGRGTLYPLLMSLAIKAVPPSDRASAMGIFQASYAFGMFIGPWISGALADSLGLMSVFVLCGGLCLACLLACLFLTARGALRAALEPRRCS
jgi:MFS family permease